MSDARSRRLAEVNDQMAAMFRERYGQFYALVRNDGFSDVDAREVILDAGQSVSRYLVDNGPVRDLVPYFTAAIRNAQADRRRAAAQNPVDLVELHAYLEYASYDEEDDDVPADSEQALIGNVSTEAALQAAKRAVAELPDYLREPFQLKIYSGLAPREIAAILGKKPQSIRAHLSVAKKRVTELTLAMLRAQDEQEGDIDE
ncbi:RNA polymerase sigma factor [Streptomyces sp. NPDC057474]|uniref:RNA polymerase sigma factor n=1 Tax=Streptomyces sp. NPDC057474 TaxID=3346144 RepID=UPI00368BB235